VASASSKAKIRHSGGLVQSVLVEVAALVVACTMLAWCWHGAGMVL
jgi:hypothetical protein